MYQDDSYHDLIAALYHTATEPAEWNKALASIATLFNGHAVFAMTVGEATPDDPAFLSFNISVETLVLYKEYYYQHDLWSPAWIQQGLHRLGNASTGTQLVERSMFLRSVWFNEFLRERDIEHSLFASLSDGSSKPLILAIDRPLGSEPFSGGDIERLRPIARHFTQALTLGRQFQALSDGIKAHEHYCKRSQRGLLSLDMQGKLLYANEFAEALLARKDGLSVTNGVLRAVTEQGGRALAYLLALAKQGMGASLIIDRPPPRPALKLQALLLAEENSPSFLPGPSAAARHTLLLLLNDEADTRQDGYARQYQLTRQESKVLQALVSGLTLKDIAERHAVSINTVRSQLAGVMQKTGCKRQKDLVRLFFCGSGTAL